MKKRFYQSSGMLLLNKALGTKLLVAMLVLVSVQLTAQDLTHYKRTVKELSSAKYQGRLCEGWCQQGWEVLAERV